MAHSADGDGYILADISTPSAKLLTPSLPPSTGEQTNHFTNSLQTPKTCVCIAIMLGRQLKGLHDVSFMSRPVAFSISVNLSEDWGEKKTVILHHLPEATNYFQWEEKSAYSSGDFGKLLRDVEQWASEKKTHPSLSLGVKQILI